MNLQLEFGFDEIVAYIRAKDKQRRIKEMESIYVANCLSLLACDKRAKEMQSFNEILDQMKGKKKIKSDDRTSKEIIDDTIKLWKKFN